jgi:hypothetical protein
MTEYIDISAIRADASAQARSYVSPDTIAEYAERMLDGDEFPPLVVFFDGKVYWLAGGFQRRDAAIKAGLTSFRCAVIEGGLREARLYACGTNAAHGVPRTNEDKRRVVMRLLQDAEWRQWSDSEVACRCKVSAPFVGKLRTELASSHPKTFNDERTVSRGGAPYIQNTAAIGRRPAVAASETRHEAFEDKAAERAEYDPAEVAEVADWIRGLAVALSGASPVLDPILEKIQEKVEKVGALKFSQLAARAGLHADIVKQFDRASKLTAVRGVLARAAEVVFWTSSPQQRREEVIA